MKLPKGSFFLFYIYKKSVTISLIDMVNRNTSKYQYDLKRGDKYVG